MNNFDFVERFIEGTKGKRLTWNEFTGTLNGCVYEQNREYNQAFYVLRDKKVILLTKTILFDSDEEVAEYRYTMRILSEDLKEIYRIDDSNLFDSEDGERVFHYNDEDKFVLARLFRLAERSARQIDRLLEELAKGLPDISDDLPF